MLKIIFIVYTLPFFFVIEAEAMSLLGIGKTCVFSEVQLHIMQDGKPLQNVTVTRQWEWNKSAQDVSNTDAKGYVSFPAVYESSVSRLLPTELVVGQQLSVTVNGEEHVIWTNAKRKPEENSEYGGQPFIAECELTNEEKLIEDFGSLMVTICKLKG